MFFRCFPAGAKPAGEPPEICSGHPARRIAKKKAQLRGRFAGRKCREARGRKKTRNKAGPF
jgi:hypothetical protein